MRSHWRGQDRSSKATTQTRTRMRSKTGQSAHTQRTLSSGHWRSQDRCCAAGAARADAVSDARRKIAARTEASRAAESPSWQDFSANIQIAGPGARRCQRSAKQVSIDTVAPNRLLTETGAAPSNHGTDHTETMRSGVDGAGEQTHPSTRQHPTAATSTSISIGRTRKGS